MPETDKKQEIMLEILENKSNGVANLVGNVFGSIYPQRPAVTDTPRAVTYAFSGVCLLCGSDS